MGYNAWENVWGIWNQLTPRDAEALRRIATLQRQCAALLVSLQWRPYVPTLQAGVFASHFPGDRAGPGHEGQALWTLVNRNEYEVAGEQLALPHQGGRRYVDLWHGAPLQPRLQGDLAVLTLPLEAQGYGAVLALDADVADPPGLVDYLAGAAQRAQTPLQSLSKQWSCLTQQMVPTAPSPLHKAAPPGMVAIPGADFDFVVRGVEIEGQTWDGLDVQYPWESSPRRSHRHRLQMKPFFIHRTPVTNSQFHTFMQASGYAPHDAQNFLRHWQGGAPLPGSGEQPVTWVDLDDARAYAAWAGCRLPHEWEWQYAAQGSDGRRYPWGNSWRSDAVPPSNRGRTLLPPADVQAHPLGASPFGVLDLVGNVWQWTDEYADEHTRSVVLRGGSSYVPQTSHWYFPQAYRLDEHGKLLLMAPGKDRSGCIGFRCVADAA